MLYLESAAAAYPDLREFSQLPLPRGVSPEAEFEVFEGAGSSPVPGNRGADGGRDDQRAEGQKRKRQSKVTQAGQKKRKKTARYFVTAVLPRTREAPRIGSASGNGSRECPVSATERKMSEDLEVQRLAKATSEALIKAAKRSIKASKVRIKAMEANSKAQDEKVRALEVYKMFCQRLRDEKAADVRYDSCIELLENAAARAFDELSRDFFTE